MYLNLKLCIWQSGIRQNRLAQALKIDEALLSKIINGFREPTSEQRRCIAQFLQKEEAWLFSRDAAIKEGAANRGDSERNGV